MWVMHHEIRIYVGGGAIHLVYEIIFRDVDFHLKCSHNIYILGIKNGKIRNSDGRYITISLVNCLFCRIL